MQFALTYISLTHRASDEHSVPQSKMQDCFTSRVLREKVVEIACEGNTLREARVT